MFFWQVRNGKITEQGKPVYLRGVNLGGWLMPEGYIMQAPNRGVRFFREAFIQKQGDKAFLELQEAFRDHYIVENDLKAIAALGVNHVRLPFHYSLVETEPYAYSKAGLLYLNKAVRWAKKYDLRVILDMHAVAGAQNHDWHSDSDGKAQFWTVPAYRRRMAALWQMLAAHFQDEPAVIGYDILNEAVTDDTVALNAYYRDVIKAIRQVDQAHIIFVEGNRWAQDIECLDAFEDKNLVLGIHFYEPLEFTFNFTPGLSYPLKGGKTPWDKKFMRERLETSVKVARKKGRALWCGEFGVYGRDGLYGEQQWVTDILANFKALDIHWTYWTWKAVRNTMFPDGVMQYLPNDPWISRPGPECGWDTWHRFWPARKKELMASWQTKNFTPNEQIVKVLSHAG